MKMVDFDICKHYYIKPKLANNRQQQPKHNVAALQ
jgi:hypothetical protein